MNHKQTQLEAGLYLVATPIGNARDITLRALDVLASADVIAAEDTRTTRRLMEIHAIPTKGRVFIPYHDHSHAGDRAKLCQAITEGKSVAYASEAGTPMVSDPGFALVRDVVEQSGAVIAIPGASAVLAALCCAGLPSDQFHFYGFLPPKTAARQKALADLSSVGTTTVFYESPKRVRKTLQDMREVFGGERPVVLCREITKKFEETLRGSIDDLLIELNETDPRGECVLLVGAAAEETQDSASIEDALVKAMETHRVKDAANLVAGSFGLPVREVYQMALSIKGK